MSLSTPFIERPVATTLLTIGLALAGLFQAEDAFMAALISGAMTVDGAAGSDTPFDPRIQAVRGHQGQIDVAAVYRKLRLDF